MLRNRCYNISSYTGLDFWRIKFGEIMKNRQIRQTLVPPTFRRLRYVFKSTVLKKGIGIEGEKIIETS